MLASAGKALIDPEVIIKKIGLISGLRVADLGCGRTGHFVFALAETVGETGIVYAVDIIKDTLMSIRKRAEEENFQNIKTVWSDVERYGYTPIPEGSLDVCFFVNTLFLLKDQVSALREASRLLRDNGMLVVVDWQKRLGMLGPTDNELLNADTVKDLAIALNFKFLENFSAGDYHYCVTFLK